MFAWRETGARRSSCTIGHASDPRCAVPPLHVAVSARPADGAIPHRRPASREMTAGCHPDTGLACSRRELTQHVTWRDPRRGPDKQWARDATLRSARPRGAPCLHRASERRVLEAAQTAPRDGPIHPRETRLELVLGLRRGIQLRQNSHSVAQYLSDPDDRRYEECEAFGCDIRYDKYEEGDCYLLRYLYRRCVFVISSDLHLIQVSS